MDNDKNCGIDEDHLNDMMMEGDLFFQEVKEFEKYFNTLPKEEQDRIEEEGKKQMGQITRAYAIDKPWIYKPSLE